MKKNIGVEATAPKEKCEDKHCPFHGNIKLRGKIFVGEVIKDAMQKTATIMWPRLFNIPKFERLERRRTKIKAHNPLCLNIKKGDKVKIMETKPISKTKHFVIIGKLKDEIG